MDLERLRQQRQEHFSSTGVWDAVRGTLAPAAKPLLTDVRAILSDVSRGALRRSKLAARCRLATAAASAKLTMLQTDSSLRYWRDQVLHYVLNSLYRYLLH